jgi:hypothetical protein
MTAGAAFLSFVPMRLNQDTPTPFKLKVLNLLKIFSMALAKSFGD